MPETKTRVRKKLFPSTQLLMTTVFLEVATVCLLVLSWAPIGSFETALALFLVANVLGIIKASIAFICQAPYCQYYFGAGVDRYYPSHFRVYSYFAEQLTI